ncbi:MAG: MFS transporter [Ilumatobacter sp.]|uniref:MFS transporter n=1 Tax=Ilumatobacter sp. TaxID=1967498 RepID=UPI0026334B19|nr:MFS transporter [Ilumatobacter sp.]MDJ0769959.1 MFS transporter [Ilumatobacter sp.]
MSLPRTPLPERPGPGAPRERLISGPFLSVTVTAFFFFLYIGIVLVSVPRFIEEELGAGEFGVGLSVASFAAAAVFARPFLGRLTDRFGRRALMMAGAVMAAAAGALTALATALWHVLLLRAVMGLGEAALFVAASTLIADLSPANRRAEAASYFSVAVFGGIGIGPTIGEAVLGDDRFATTFLVGSAFALVTAFTVLGVPRRVDRTAAPAAAKAPLFHRAALWPGVVLATGIAALSVYFAFIPDHSREVGLAGSAGLFLVYSAVSLSLRLLAAKVPERLGAHRTVSIALVTLTLSLVLISSVAEPWALWLGAAGIGAGMAFMYPSLMANVVNRVGDHERASALSSFTMFFEVGSVAGGLVLGAVGQVFSKQAGFFGGAVATVIGLVVLWRFVVATPTEPEPATAGGLAPTAS